MESNEPGPPGWIGLRDASLVYGHITALNRIDFALLPGEFHALTGNHNDGKSSLCRVLAGIAAPSSGEVWADGAAKARFGVREAAELGVEYVGDTADIFPHMSAMENMTIGTYGRAGRFFAPAVRRDVIEKWFAGFGIKRCPWHPVSEYPAEDKLLIKILGCLYREPRLLILDETLEQFTYERRLILAEELRKRIRRGMTVLWATHELDDALEWANRITVLRNGRRYLTAETSLLDRRSLIRMTYSSTREYSGDSNDHFENFYNLVRYSEVLLEHLPSAVFVMDAAEKIQFANASGLRLLSLEDEYRPGMPASEAFGWKNPKILDMVRDTLDTREGISAGGFSFTGGNGKILADVRTLAVVNAEGRLSVMLVLDDVSDRENMRKRLVMAHNLSSIGMLAAGVAHEVNNPLESIGNYISYLLRRAETPESRDVLDRVQKEADHIRDIVTNLVMFSGKGGRTGLEVDLADMIRDIVAMLGYNSSYDDIEIETALPERPLVVRIDPNEFRQIILNLIRNGMEAMPGGGAIRITLDHVGQAAARVDIRDYGSGIDPELLRDSELFLPFVSGKGGDADNQGLGLSIVYGLVKKWGGSIAVEAAEPGTRFIVEFPLSGDGA